MGVDFDSVIRCGPYPQVPDRFKKKKSGKGFQYMVSRPRNRFGSANRVGPESGCDCKHHYGGSFILDFCI